MYTNLIMLLPAIALGTVAGLVTGLIPAVGPLLFLSSVYIFLSSWSPIEILMFYMSLLIISQYVDAIPAVYLGVPGETSAIPTAYESRYISPYIKESLIRVSALGRTIGCVSALLLTLAVLQFMHAITGLFSARTQIVLFSLALVGIAATGNNRWYINVILMVAGYVVGLVGYNFYFDREILTGGWVDLFNGVPMIPFIIGIYAIPTLYSHLENQQPFSSILHDGHEPAPVNRVFRPSPVILRSTIFGYMFGLIPGISYVLSGTGSYSIEKWLRDRKNKQPPGDPHLVVACETGNSTGSFSTLLPLLYFGIPITASEAMIYEIMVQNGALFQQGEMLIGNLTIITVSLLLIVFAGLILSWPLARYCLDLLLKIRLKYLYTAVLVFCVFTVMLNGWIENIWLLNLVVLCLSIIVGFMLRRFDILPLIFVFILQASIESSTYEMIKIFF